MTSPNRPTISVTPNALPTSKAKLWAVGIATKLGYLLALAIATFVLLRLLAWAEGYSWAEVSPLGALFLATIADALATLTKD